MLDSLSNLFTKGLKAVLSIFPDSPFGILYDLAESSDFGTWFGMLNWFVPVYSFIAILEGWLTCIALYYVWQVVLRWLKVVK